MPPPEELPGNEVRMTPLIPSLDWPGWLQQTVFVRSPASPPPPPSGPTLVSFVVDTDGVSFTATFSETVACGEFTNGFNVLTGGSGNGANLNGTGTTITGNLNSTAYVGQDVLVSYYPGTIASSPAGVPLTEFANFVGTNNSTQPLPPPAHSFAQVVDVSGTGRLYELFNQSVTGNAGISLTRDGSPVSLTFFGASGATVIYTFSPPPATGEVFLVSYTPGDIVAAAGSHLAVEVFTDQSVYNAAG